MIQPSHFYLVCADSELEVRCETEGAIEKVAFTVTDITAHGWETYQRNQWRSRDVVAFVDAAHRALMRCKEGG